MVFKWDQWQVKQTGLKGKETEDTEKVNTAYYYFISAAEGRSLTKDKDTGSGRIIKTTLHHICDVVHSVQCLSKLFQSHSLLCGKQWNTWSSRGFLSVFTNICSAEVFVSSFTESRPAPVGCCSASDPILWRPCGGAASENMISLQGFVQAL